MRDFLAYEIGGPILLNWDYRNDLPRDVPAGEFAKRSLAIVDQSQLLIGVLGPTVPALTRREILRAYERQAQGEMQAYVLADRTLITEAHNRLLRKINRDYRRDVQYGYYHTYTDFFHQIYLTLFRYLVGTTDEPGPLR